MGTPGSWKKGQSGNPGGRVKGVERVFQDELAKLAGVDNTTDRLAGLRPLIARAHRIALHGEDRDANAAIKFLVERSAGLPQQHIAISDDTPPEREIDWSQVPLEKRRELLGALAEIEALTTPHDGTTDH